MEKQTVIYWPEFENKASETAKQLWNDIHFTYVNLATSDDQQITAHTIILSSSSQLIYLKNINYLQLKNIMEFIYLGQCKRFSWHRNWSEPQTRAGPPFLSPLLCHIFYIGTSISSAYSNILIDLLGTGFTGAQVYKFTRGPKGPSRWPKAPSPPQELEVGTLQAYVPSSLEILGVNHLEIDKKEHMSW